VEIADTSLVRSRHYGYLSPITTEKLLSTAEAPSPWPEQEAFHQHLRALAQSAVRTVLELVMREELDAFIGAAWGECSPKRKGYRSK
jgi:hypothetical protein